MTLEAEAIRVFATSGEKLNAGDLRGALGDLLHVKRLQEGNRWETYHLLGICYRLMASYEEAGISFGEALRLVDKDFDRARIIRDRGMLFLDRGWISDATDDFMSSAQTLELLLAEGGGDSDEIELEYAASLGFVGRGLLRQGRLRAAAEVMRKVDKMVKGRKPPYELNNLVWLLKSISLPERLKLARRALQLAREAGNRKRQMEIRLIVISPKLADVAKRLLVRR
jgi:tetratricopeptide (TPR) repeat protein